MTMDQESSGDESTEFKSRGYQDEILKACIERNTIIYLPTGAGKTYIAIMALKHFAKDLEKPISEGGKRSVFLTNTVALAHQQAEVISKSTPLKVAVYTGDMNVDAWKHDEWFNEFEQNQVITATVQIVLDVIRHGYLKISDFNLMIFDECHHAQKGHPMLMLMEKFRDIDGKIPEKDHPRIIGLTGMLTTASIKPQNVLEDLRRLEGTFRGTITTAKGAAFTDVLMYSTRPVESVLAYETNLSSGFQEFIIRKVESMLELIKNWPLDTTHEIQRDFRKDKQPKIQTKYETICKEFIYQISNLGLYGATLANLAAIVDMELKKREASTTAARWVSRALITCLEEILHIHIRKVYDIDDEEDMQNDDEIDEQTVKDDPTTILTSSSPQVQKLLIFLKKAAEEHKKSDQPLKGLIFVQRRYTARILCHVVRRYANAYPDLNIHVDFMTGRNAFMPDSVETLMGNKNNNRVLDKFKRDEINIIIATSVLEEGIDLQECNLVICYDTPLTFRSYVQTKGRARMKQSQYVIMTKACENMKLQKKADEWQKINKILRDYLVERAIDRSPPLQDDIEKAVEQKYNEKFVTAKGAAVDYNSATALINRYCGCLPTDWFTVPAIQWEETPVKNHFSVSILLPIQSSLKNKITGKTLPTLKLAKRSAAFEAIKQLYHSGELTDNLLPINRQKCLDKYKDVYFKEWKHFEDDKPKTAGTKKNFRMHDIQTPTSLIDSMPRENTQLYLYEIQMEPKFQVGNDTCFDPNDENIRIFHQLLQSPRTYGILTTKLLPRMGLMKFFQSFGQITCSISYEPKPITLGNPQKLAELKRFHCILFRNILDIWKEFFVYDFSDSVIVVPTNDNQIDWNIVEQFQSWSELKRKTISERMSVEYRERDWLYSVICPWYRADDSVRYVVTQVLPHLTPLSQFPNDDFQSYADYALNKYPDISKVVNDDQFLIDVKAITTKLNRLHAGDGEDGRRNARPKPRGPELLIPELCHNFRYPGDLWLKAINLPSVLHRITYILHAENLRVSINNYVGLEISDYYPNPLFENMARNKSGYAKAAIQNSIVHPRADESQAKVLKANDVARFDADTALLGPEIHEPVDLERHFDNVYEVDIDYYYQFINRALNGLSLDNKNDNNTLLSPHRFHTNVPALCDAPAEDKLHINILDQKLSTPNARGVEQHEILAALTSASSSDVFHMELFEVLGDAFLKFGVSLYLIQKHVEWHEGFLTTIKGQIVGNRNLCYTAIRHNLPGMIKIQQFNPKDDWQPPMFKVEHRVQEYMKEYNISPDLLYKLTLSMSELENGVVSDDTLEAYVQRFMDDAFVGGEDSSMQNFLGKQRMSDKTCADCVEAIIGTCVKSIGVERTFKVLEMLGILPRNGTDISRMLQNKLRSPRIRTNISDYEVDYFLANHQKLEKSIGYTFKDRAYLLQALTHPSYPTNRVTGCYQQLEFLGDAVLDFLITAYIFERCPEMDPGQLTDLRSALVNNVTLACLCVRYNIHVHILSQSAVLTESVSRFVDFQRKHNHDVADHVELLMEEQDVHCKMADYVDVPKTLGDVFEAIIGGIFLDSGNDLEVTWKVIYRLMEKELNKFMANVPIQMVRQLYEFPNANPEFDVPVVDEELDTVLVNLRFTCNGEILLVHGFGANKENAKRAAAKLALSKLTRC